ncbi:type II and III secretion system protein family protein [Lichenicola cladoniae]|uniref:Type II and III secretion system protein family protein n=1 Tax=Lichenicola cladoniae TaxID=1484109 RepID=A0A6M8HM28_9PROT|nr:type II and III secretion system protein family protein [Lichenicola cladoniae]NPD69968.1 type II and III secretion system protein family protein [Acetobacteraceae bacterium]QKE89386.1 type II and III secretion system protein family protein [Lichenicola cladoniae]
MGQLRSSRRAIALAACTGVALATPIVLPQPVEGRTRHETARYVSMAQARIGQPAALTLEMGAGKVIDVHRPAANVFVANPKVVDVRPASPSTFFVFGLAPGRSTVAALDASGRRLASYEVVVQPSSFAAGEGKALLNRELPGNDISVQTTAGGLEAAGTVATPEDASGAVAALAGSLPKGATLDNRTGVNQSVQVLLRVRVAEMSRQVTRELGINWQVAGAYAGRVTKTMIGGALPSATYNAASALIGLGYQNSGTSINAIVDALAQDNSAHLLAEPDLVTMSGQPADFLVGGQYPIPVSSSLGQINVTYKEYGVKLDFVPTVLGSNRILLHVRPEVSSLTTQGAIQTGTGNTAITIPALTIRRADTTVELGSGQSLAIAGMLQKNYTQTDSGIPGLSDIPVVGSLFRSDNFSHSETELVIIVTPYLVQPVDDPSVLKTPDQDFTPPNDLERIFLLRQTSLTGRADSRADHVFPADAGFIVK